jgi:glycerol-3-phosphate dehydrogenase (NAD(P)+)
VTPVAVLGAGAWGTVLADLLGRKGYPVRLWAYEAEVVDAINSRRENPLFLAGCPLAAGISAHADIAAVVRDAECLVSASPSHVTRGLFLSVAPHLGAGAIVASATKGIETESLQLMSQVAREALPPHRFVALSGPSFAQEVYQGQPTAIAAASTDTEAARCVQELLATSYFRVYSNTDVVGTELCGSLKNVIAIAAGILEGLGLGNNPRAALITRGLAEMTRLGLALGADPRTFAGLAGMGDLILTTCGALSRNRALGIALAGGTTLEGYRAAHRTVAEGATTARAALRLAERERVEMPIVEQVCAILYRGKPPRQAIADLMERTLKSES